MTTSVSPKPSVSPNPDTGMRRSAAAGSVRGPARGIAMGAALSAPLWVGIVYGARSLVGLF